MFKTYVVAILLLFRHCYWYNKCSEHLLLFYQTLLQKNNTLAKTQVVIELLVRLCHCYYVVARAVVLSDTVVNTNMTQVVAMLFFWVVNTKQIFNHKWDLKTAVTSCQYFYLASSVATEQRRGMAIRRSCSGAGGNWQWAMLDAVMLRGA